MAKDTKLEKRTVGAILEESARKFGTRPFIYFRDEVVSFEQMNQRATSVAHYFLSMGYKKGDKVVLLLGNCPEWFYVWFGLAKIGVIVVALNFAHKGPILAHQINNSDATLMVAGKRFLDSVRSIRDELANLTTLVLHPDDDKTNEIGLRTISFPELLKVSPRIPDIDLHCYDTVAIPYTSGTTGPSKGVVQSHNQYARCGEQTAKQLDLSEDDVFYCWFPLFHIVPAMIFMSALLVGSSIALVDTFSVRRFWDDIKRYNATISAGFATMIELLYKQPPKPDDAANPIRRLIIGHPSESIRKSFEKRFNVAITDDYGMTEIDPLSYSSVEDRDRKPGSCGKAAQDLDVRIFDDCDNELGPREVGEIVIRPKEPFIMMKEYYKMPEKTLETCRNLWFHTGDYGYLDEEGFLYFVDRKKDCIRRRGENISSYELETIINTHPCVLECAAVGVPYELGDEDVKLVVKLREGETLTPEELMEFCEENMAFFIIPRYIEFIDEFPRTETSKILKSELKSVTEKTWDREKAGYRIKR